jgi:sugar/nucleoside kinase (ribokinase family)
MIRVDAFPAPHAATIFPDGWHETIGSSGAGAAMNLARLGIEVVFHCPLGVDLAGDEIRLGLTAAGVVVDPVTDPTGTATRAGASILTPSSRSPSPSITSSWRSSSRPET